jgi:hypothetical protein
MTTATKTYSVPFARSDFNAAMVCPVCGLENIHPVAVRVNPAGAFPGSVGVTVDGIFLDKTALPSGRGVVMELYFACESQHRFAMEFRFHKGSTYTTLRVLSDGVERTIWRD